MDPGTMISTLEQLASATNRIFTVERKQRQENLKVAKFAEALRLEVLDLRRAKDDLTVQLSQADAEAQKAKENLMNVKADKSNLEIRLKVAGSRIEKEERLRCDVQARNKTLERQVALIRELVLTSDRRSLLSQNELQELDLLQPSNNELGLDVEESAMLSLSLDPSASDLDATGDMDASELRNGRKWRRAMQRTFAEDEEEEVADAPPKKKRRSSAVVTTPTVEVTAKTVLTLSPPSTEHVLHYPRRTPPAGRRPPTRALRQQVVSGESEPDNDFEDEDDDGEDNFEPQKGTPKKPTSIKRCASVTSVASTATLVDLRPHEFVKKSIVTRETCKVCSTGIKFATTALKCRDCRIICHELCRENAPLPCVPATQTPQGKKQRKDGTLQSYVPRNPPFVPSLVINCIKEVERRGMDEVGIYRLPGKERNTRELRVKLLNSKNHKGVLQQMKEEDINVVCCALKTFFRELREPLLTHQLNSSFIAAAELDVLESRIAVLESVVGQLPAANQQTLAYLMMHLQRVAANSSRNQMSRDNLAIVFAPTIVGYDNADPTPAARLQAVPHQQQVVSGLLGIDIQFWTSILNSRDMPDPALSPASPQSPASISSPSKVSSSLTPFLRTPVHIQPSGTNSPGTPEARPAPEISSVLGPITPGGSRATTRVMPMRRARKRQGGFFSNPKGQQFV